MGGGGVQTKLKSNNKNTIALFKVNYYTEHEELVHILEERLLLNPILVHCKHIYWLNTPPLK